jgi:hypothetical protein
VTLTVDGKCIPIEPDYDCLAAITGDPTNRRIVALKTMPLPSLYRCNEHSQEGFESSELPIETELKHHADLQEHPAVALADTKKESSLGQYVAFFYHPSQ